MFFFLYINISKIYIHFSAIDLITNLLQVKQRKRFTVDKSLVHVLLQVNKYLAVCSFCTRLKYFHNTFIQFFCIIIQFRS